MVRVRDYVALLDENTYRRTARDTGVALKERERRDACVAPFDGWCVNRADTFIVRDLIRNRERLHSFVRESGSKVLSLGDVSEAARGSVDR